MKTHFFNQQWQTGSGAEFASINPATNQSIWHGNEAGAAEVNAAVASARAAFSEWSKTALDKRVALLQQYQVVLHQNKQAIAEAIAQETGKPLWESQTEAATMIAKVDVSIKAYHQRSGESPQRGEKGVQQNGQISMQLTHRPHGVMVVFGPYNFPGHLPNGHIVPALLAGNCIVFKPSELTALVGQMLVDYLQQAGFPKGVINLLQGGRSTGELLSQHNDINGLLFTGSSNTGKLLHKQFAGHPEKLLALEMGGNNPLIFHRVKDTKAAVWHALQSAFITAGQRCTCARRLIVVKDDNAAQFVEQLVKASAQLKLELPSDDSFFGPVISNQVADNLLAAQQSLLDKGAKDLLLMQRKYDDKPLLTPAILDVTAVKKRVDEEWFGPLLQLIWVENLEQAIDEANNTQYGLSAGILTDDDAVWQQFYQAAHCGILNRNRPTTGASGAAPFGGTGSSGNHRPSAFYAADYCAYPMASMLDEQVRLPDDLGVGVKL